MKLKARIRTNVYDLAVGATFSDEVNETLDSGVIIIDNVPSFDIEPFDDVYIYDGVFNGVNLAARTYIGIETTSEEVLNWSEETEMTNVNGEDITIGSAVPYFVYYGNDIANLVEWITNYNDFNEDTALVRFLNKFSITITIRTYNSASGVSFFNGHVFTAQTMHSPMGIFELTSKTFGTDKTLRMRAFINGDLGYNKNQSWVLNQYETAYIHSATFRYGENKYKRKSVSDYATTFRFLASDRPFSATQEIITIMDGVIERELLKVAGSENIIVLAEGGTTYLVFNKMPDGYFVANKTAAHPLIFKEWSYATPQTEFIRPEFYRHMLVDTFTKERVSLTDNVFKYKITLFSETKGLETVQLPNKSFTQPFNIDKKLSVAEIAERMVELYSPKMKVATSEVQKTYQTQQKYRLHYSIFDIFDDVYVEVALDEPNLRTLLDYLFSTKERIAVVRDFVIYAVDQTERKGEFLLDNDINLITESMSSQSYAGHLKRKYNQAIAQNKTSKRIEYLGFRNNDEGLLTLDNMRLETRFNIYSIDKVYMCYYKKVSVQDNESGVVTDKMILCKQDITPLVKLNQERQMLSKDWDDFTSNTDTHPKSVQELAEYRIATVGYDRGSNVIGGWGEKYEYPMHFWQTGEKTYIENILSFMDAIYPFGVNTFGYVQENMSGDFTVSASYSFPNDFLYPSAYNNTANAMKGLFFEVEYTPFYDGTIIHSKDNATSDVIFKDNPASSLSVLETDGALEKEKINRLGNAVLQINAVHSDYSKLRETQTVYDNDVIIYRREYQINVDHILANYEGTRSAVLKNYFTSVLEKLRPFPLKPYGESILRAENKKVFVKLDKKVLYNETQLDLDFEKFATNDKLLLSGVTASPILQSVDNFDKSNQINGGFFVIGGEKYASDINTFVSGNSLCFNIQMDSNVTGGVYIDKVAATVDDDFKGTIQKSYMTVDDIETGYIEELGVYVAHVDQKNVFSDKVQNVSTVVINNTYTKLHALPKLDFSDNDLTNIVGNTFAAMKDNQEILNYTFQIEPLGTDDVFISQWFMKLSDLYGVYNKVRDTYKVDDINGGGSLGYLYASSIVSLMNYGTPNIQIDIPNGIWGSLITGMPVSIKPIRWAQDHVNFINHRYYEVTLTELISKDDNTMVFKGSVKYFNDNAGINRNYIETFTFFRAGYKPPNFDHNNQYDYEHSFGYNTDTTLDVRSFLWQKKLKPELEYGDPENQDEFLLIEREMENIGDIYSKMRLVSPIGTTIQDFLNIGEGGEKITKTYAQNMYYLSSNAPMKRSVLYNEYKLANIPAHYTIVPNAFEVKRDNLGSYLQANLLGITGDTLEYWFLDGDGALKFVFGVNISQTDRDNGFIRVRMSLMNNLDKKVYGGNALLIGTKSNYIDGDKDLNKNYYDDII